MEHEDSRSFSLARAMIICLWISLPFFIVGIVILTTRATSGEDPVPSVDLVSMSFTVLNITETRLSAKWDLSIRIPSDLLHYICLQGDFQASFLYKNVTLATSSPQKYSNLYYGEPYVLTVSTVGLEKDFGGLIEKDIRDDIKEKKEVKFVSRFFLTDCREKTNGRMSFACGEATLRFEPGSEMDATLFGNHPTCINI